MNKHVILSIILGIASLVLLVLLSISSAHAFKERKRAWYRRNVNPKIRVEVINASGVPGLAKKVTFKLREDGFDVVYYSHQNDTIEKTVIVERSDSSLSHAKHLAKWLGVNEITLEWDCDKLSDCAIVVGKDFNKYFPGLDTAIIVY